MIFVFILVRLVREIIINVDLLCWLGLWGNLVMGYSRDIWFSVKISFWGLKEFKYFSRIFFNKEGREYFEKKYVKLYWWDILFLEV